MGKTAKRQNKRAAAAVLQTRGGTGGKKKGKSSYVAAAAFTAAASGMQTDDAAGVDVQNVDEPGSNRKTATSIGRVARAVEGNLIQEACVALDVLLAEVQRGERSDAAPLDLCSKVLGMCQKNGKAKPALRLLQRMDSCGLPVGPVQLRQVFFACCTKGMVHEALALMSRFESGDSQKRALGTDVLVRGCGLIPGGVDSELAHVLLEGALRGSANGGINPNNVWEPVPAHLLKFHPPSNWKPSVTGVEDDDKKKIQSTDVSASADALAQTIYPGGASGDESFWLVSCDDGRRRPADRNELQLWAPAHENTIPLEPPGLEPDTDRIDVPLLPNAFTLTNFLTEKECASFRAAAHAAGWRRDQGTATQSADDRLDYCEILVWPQTCDRLFCRIKSHLPVGAVGINARLRFFRYGPDTVYRKHVDGSWPESFLTPEGSYIVDKSNGKKRSKLTLLIYLTDGFLGGGTTFYGAVPNRPGEVGSIGVLPIEGAALCFPHGESSESPVHEGSAVFPGPNGEKHKYIIRTDVLFDLEK